MTNDTNDFYPYHLRTCETPHLCVYDDRHSVWFPANKPEIGERIIAQMCQHLHDDLSQWYSWQRELESEGAWDDYLLSGLWCTEDLVLEYEDYPPQL